MSDFLFREIYYNCFNKISNESVRLAIIDSLCECGVKGTYDLSKYSLSKKERIAVEVLIRHPIISIKNTRERYEKAVINGKKGGRPKKNKEGLPDSESADWDIRGK